MKKFLVIMQHSPYANSKSLEALEFALALSAFEVPVNLLLRGDAIIQLCQEQDTDKLVGKDFTKIYSNLSIFGIKDVYVVKNDLKAYAGDVLSLAPIVIEETDIADLLKAHDVILNT